MPNQNDGKTRAQRFWEKVDTAGPCWLWTASKDSGGYGTIGSGGKIRKAHRVSWEMHRGPIPKGLCVLHRCDVRGCVNPEHLFLGTQDDNMKDCAAKGRIRCVPQHGESNPMAKFSSATVARIREMVSAGISGAEAARITGVSPMQVSRIVRKLAWKHI